MKQTILTVAFLIVVSPLALPQTRNRSKEPGTFKVIFEREVQQGKWRAIGELGLAYDGLALNDPLFFPYYEVCERKGIPVFFHTGLDGPEPQRLVREARLRRKPHRIPEHFTPSP